jgi:hypothetical protein
MSAWFKCFPERILESYDTLDSDQRAAAYTLTMLIYQHDGPLRLSEATLAGRCGFNLRKYRRVLGELQALGKFYTTPSGSLSNERADELLEQRRAARDYGSEGGKKRAANARSKKIDQEQKHDQFSNGEGKSAQNNDNGQGSLGFGFKYKEGDSSEAKASGAEAPQPSHWDVMAAALAEQSGSTPKTERAFLGLLARELKNHGGDDAFREIILAALTEQPADLKPWLRKAVAHRKANGPPKAARPTIALCRLGDLSWNHDWTTHENFTIVDGRRVPLDHPLTAEEQAVVDRQVARNLDNRRAA